MGNKFLVHKQLIERCRKQDAEAQFRVYELYYKAVYNTCMRIVGIPSVAEELMQDSFLSAFSKLHQYNGNVAFGAWLRKIAVNKSLDYLKLNKHFFIDLDENYHSETINESEIDFDNLG